MKIALLLSIACAALILSGCSTSSGGSEDTYSTSSGSVTDPSLPQDPNMGPQMVPP